MNYKKLLDYLREERDKHIIIGIDHNYDLLKSDLHNATHDFINYNLDHDMWPVITKPTCITRSTATLIDNIIVSSEIYSSYLCGILIDDLSDHLPCLLVARNIKLSKKEIPSITSRKVTPKTISRMKELLEQKDLCGDIKLGSINEAFDHLHYSISSVIDQVSPYEQYTPSKQMYRKDPWLPVGLLKSIKKQKKLYQKTLVHPNNTTLHEQYRQYQNLLTKLKHDCKCNYYHEKCCEYKSNTKALWGIINNMTNRNHDKTNIISYLEHDGIGNNNPTKIANALNGHFSTVGKQYASAIKRSKKNIKFYLSALSNNSKCMFWVPTTPVKVLKIIMDLPNKRSSGYDKIDNLVLKKLKYQICVTEPFI